LRRRCTCVQHARTYARKMHEHTGDYVETAWLDIAAKRPRNIFA
jgi:hypothetical protein